MEQRVPSRDSGASSSASGEKVHPFQNWCLIILRETLKNMQVDANADAAFSDVYANAKNSLASSREAFAKEEANRIMVEALNRKERECGVLCCVVEKFLQSIQTGPILSLLVPLRWVINNGW